MAPSGPVSPGPQNKNISCVMQSNNVVWTQESQTQVSLSQRHWSRRQDTPRISSSKSEFISMSHWVPVFLSSPGDFICGSPDTAKLKPQWAESWNRCGLAEDLCSCTLLMRRTRMEVYCAPSPSAVRQGSINNSKNPEEEAHSLLIFAIISSRDLLTICLV